MIQHLLMVALGSALGGVCRYLLAGFISSRMPALFPWGTFAVNVLGCLIIGLIYGFIDRGMHMGEATRLLLTVGFCGGFTTFSTFAHEGYLLFGHGHTLALAAYAAASLFAGLLAAHCGHLLAGSTT